MLSDPSPTGVREGEVLAGKYRIDKILGAGGMGVVVAAHHLKLDERVAIKFLLPVALTNGEAVARFEREARAAVKIKSEHVARVIDVGTLETGAPYIVMEHLEGGDLSAWLLKYGPLPVEQAVEFVLQACEAVAEAHALGIIHRDLKPANLFVVRRADALYSVKVLDFGISKVSSFGTEENMGMTKTSAVMGSPLYMSPEQMEASRNVDLRTDIWAIGVILHELLTGQAPFNGETLAEVCIKVATRPAPPLRETRPDLPPAIESVISRCLEKDRTKRYANVAELALALAPLGPKRARPSVERISRIIQAAGLSASALSLPPSSRPQHSPANTVGAWGSTARSLAKHRPVAIAVVVACGALAGASTLAWRALSLRGPPSPVGSAPAVAAADSASAVPMLKSVSNEPQQPETHAAASAVAAPGAAPSSTVTPPPVAPARTAAPRTAAPLPPPHPRRLVDPGSVR